MIARDSGASQVLFHTQPGNDAILRTIGHAGLLARIRREGNVIRIAVGVRALTRDGSEATRS